MTDLGGTTPCPWSFTIDNLRCTGLFREARVKEESGGDECGQDNLGIDHSAIRATHLSCRRGCIPICFSNIGAGRPQDWKELGSNEHWILMVVKQI